MDSKSTSEEKSQELLQPQSQQEPFTFQLSRPFSRVKSTTKFVVDGMLREGGFLSLCAKPKTGKSSLTRHLAVCCAKGKPFLGRDVVRGETLLISIEDSLEHVDTCLRALEYDPQVDEAIHLVDFVSNKLEDNIAAISSTLQAHPNIRIVVLDTLAKVVKVKDSNDYDAWLPVFGKIRDLLRNFPSIGIVALVHLKKVTGDDIFDSMLGSSAIRSECDCNCAMYKAGSLRVITTEGRAIRAIEPTTLDTQLVVADGSNVVSNFELGTPLESLEEERKVKTEARRNHSVEAQVIEILSDRENLTATYGELRKGITGKEERKKQACDCLLAQGVVVESGIKNSSLDPHKLTLIPEALPIYELATKFIKGGIN